MPKLSEDKRAALEVIIGKGLTDVSILFDPAIIVAAEKDCLEGLHLLLPLTSDGAQHSALSQAATQGNLEFIRVLTSKVTFDEYSLNTALCNAIAEGHVSCVRFLLTVADPSYHESKALRAAAKGSRIECLKMLIPVSDATAYESGPLQWAAGNGWVEGVKLLIPVSNPKSDHSVSLRRAVKGEHEECVKLLIPVSDPEIVKELGL